jgi:hypothetical protein
MKIVTSVTVFNDAVGKRMSVSFSEIDDTTGQIVADNKRIDRVLTDTKAVAAADKLKEFAQVFVDAL